MEYLESPLASLGQPKAADDTTDSRDSTPPHSGHRLRRLRARRIRTDELQLGKLEAWARHPVLGTLHCDVEDLSLAGMALVVPRAESERSVALIGDRLDALEVSCAAGAIFRGGASVRRVTEREGSLVLGIELHGDGIDLAEVYRLGTHHGFAERFAATTQSRETDLTTEFKVYVADLRAYLERVKEFLDREESALQHLDKFSRDQALAAYREEAAPRVIERLNRASGELRLLVGGFSAEQHAAHRAHYQAQLLGLMQHAPIFKRASGKPLGYAGDYEMMNMLYRDHAEGTSLFGRVLNLYAGQDPAAQAVVNRLGYLAQKIEAAVGAGRKVRVASIGCGPAQEISHLLRRRPELGRYLEIALIDQEERVLTYCERTLAPLVQQTSVRIDFIRESVRRLLAARQLGHALGERDLIYSAGLFDYLDTRSFSALLGVLHDALAPGGQLVVGNYSKRNPSRYFMEYCLDWYLIHRDEQELRQFAQNLAPTPRRVAVDAEPLGLNIFLNSWK